MTLVYQMLERVYESGLWTYILLAVLAMTAFSLAGYIKTVVIALKMNGPKVIPFIGNILMLRERNLLTYHMSTIHDLYGTMVRFWVLMMPFFIILHPNDLQVVLSSKKHIEKTFFYKLLHNFLGNGLITSSGERWSGHRKLLQPLFHLSILDKFIGTFVDASDKLIDNIQIGSNEVNVTHLINNSVMDILNESVLGVPVKKKMNETMEDSPYRQGKMELTTRITKPWLLLDWIYSMTSTASEELDQQKRLTAFTTKMIQIRRKAIEKGDLNERKCLLDFMIEMNIQNPSFTETDIIHEACTFMLAGQDSVGAAVAFCLFLLTQNPEIQKRCYDELSDIFHEDRKRSPTMSDLRGMRYLEQCIKETLRLYPSVPLLARYASEEMNYGDVKLPSGSRLLILPYATHRLPEFYPDPEKFDPERFSSEEIEKRHPYAYIPFSAGPRNCIGAKFAIIEMKTLISKILRNYELVPVPGKTKVNPIFRLTVRASGGLWIRFKARV